MSVAVLDSPQQEPAPGRSEPPSTAPPARAYLQRPLPMLLIFAAFFSLTIPLSIVYRGQIGSAMTAMESLATSPLAQVYICCLGVTHFFVTFTVYLQSGNLRHFASTAANRIIFFAIPISIFVFFDLYAALGIDARFVGFAALVLTAVRFFDFLHFNRQNYGVLQLFKGKSSSLFPGWMRRIENAFFFSLVLLLLKTFLREDHRIDLRDPWTLVLLTVSGGLFCAILYGFAVALRRAPRPASLAAPLGYLLLQSAAAGIAIYSTALYLFSLAIHYVEYHVLMAPRCFKAPLDETSRLDRCFDRLRRHKVVFYAVLLGVAGVFTWMTRGLGGADESDVGYRLLIHVFDGLFVFHYFVEAFIWKFGDPYFRQTLGPLYFPRPAARA